MRPITVLRAAAWIGVAICGWSLNIRWGVDPNLPNGPPGQWERHVVGAALLAFIGAMAISVSGRGHKPPSNIARGISLGAAICILIIGVMIYRGSQSSVNPEIIAGPGFMWMLSGAGLLLGAAVGTLGLRAPEVVKTGKGKANPRRKKGKTKGSKKRSRARK